MVGLRVILIKKMDTHYNFRLAEPKETLSVYIKQTDKSGMLLSACQIGKKEQISTKRLLINFLKHPMMTIKIIMESHTILETRKEF